MSKPEQSRAMAAVSQGDELRRTLMRPAWTGIPETAFGRDDARPR